MKIGVLFQHKVIEIIDMLKLLFFAKEFFTKAGKRLVTFVDRFREENV